MPSTDTALPPRSDLAQQAFDRASGGPLILGNSVRIHLDGKENYPAWLRAISEARRSILFENYIIEEDEIGTAFADALIERAKAGVQVRLLRDWLGCTTGSSRRFWRRMVDAGIELRTFNPPGLGSPLGWVSRDHRKMISVDGAVGFVAGLCVSQRWMGDARKRIEPWRDTGTELRGPAVAALEEAFAEVWATAGPPWTPVPNSPSNAGAAGSTAVRIVAGRPTSSALFRLDQMIAAAAQHRLWLTDAYFVGFAPYVQALRGAAQDGVDVRLLVPSTTDLPLVSPLSRSGYRPLLDAGVRVFEWNGSMIHAKTAVADGRWARVGSSNLNLASFIGNFELDVAIEDETWGRAMEEIYLRDLENSTEITLVGRRVRRKEHRKRKRAKGARRPPVGAVRFANAVQTAASSGTRVLGSAESGLELALAAFFLGLAVMGLLWPRLLAYPLALMSGWLGLALALRARRNAVQRRAEKRALEEGRTPRPLPR